MKRQRETRPAGITIVYVITALLLLCTLAAAPLHACSKRALSAPLTESQVFFTGVASPDTVAAGSGDVDYRLGDGGPDASPARPIYGQVFRVERIGGPQAGQLPADLEEIIVVPWSYDAGCETLPWTMSAHWTPPGTRGFVVATLRVRDHWVDGRPTVDLHNPYNLPYTGRERSRSVSPEPPIAKLLSPDQVFALHEVLPTRSGLARAEAEALAPLRAWAEEYPELARRPPADMVLSLVLYAMDRAALLATDHPVLGTWRFTLHVPGRGTRTFYARSEPHPTTRWSPHRGPRELDAGGVRLRPADGYTFLVYVGSALEDLPAAVDRRLDHATAYMNAFARPDSLAEGERSWRGRIESSLLNKAIPGHPLVQRAAAEASERFSDRHREGLPTETPARFVLGADGILRVRQEFSLTGAQDLLLEGERISRTVVQTRW